MAMRYPVVSENFTISRVHRDWNHQEDSSRSVGSKLKKHDSIFRSLAEAQIDTNKTTSHHSRRLSSLVASAREGASKQLQLEERTKTLEQNLATTNVKVLELGHAYVSIEGRTETIENEFRGLRQQLQAVNEQMAHIVTTTVGTNNNINWNYGEIVGPGPGPEHGIGGQELVEVDNVVVASPSTAAARQKTKCTYCSKFLLDVGRHIKERCHFAPVEMQFSATRYRLRERQMCDICGGRFEKQGITRHRITCARRYNVGADVIPIEIDTDPLGCEASNRWSPPVLRQHSYHHPQKKK